jgi:DNA-3-methyladenine glycosylase II
MRTITSISDLTEATEHVVRIEPRFARVIARTGLPALRLTEPGLKSLLRIVTDQLISLKAGEAIWRRIEDRIHPFEPDTILSLTIEQLRALGLSNAKAQTFVAVAHATKSGLLAAHTIERMSDADAAGILRSIRGIGPWTADIYLLTAMGRANAWPAGDLALQMAAQDVLQLQNRPNQRDMQRIAEPWEPVRSAAARLLWSHYRDLKGMSQAII